MANPVGTCALCRARDVELRRSHIIPEFFYSDAYDETGRFLVLTTDPDDRAAIRQKGIWEHLLCGSCEGKTAKWDDYAKDTLDRWADPAVPLSCDYARMKLFAMSMLYRAAVARRREFGDVILRPKHRKRLQRALLADDPLEPAEFGFVIVRPGAVMRALAAGPVGPGDAKLTRGILTIKFLLRSMVWTFFVNDRTREIFRPEEMAIDRRGLLQSKPLAGVDEYLDGLMFRIASAHFARAGR